MRHLAARDGRRNGRATRLSGLYSSILGLLGCDFEANTLKVFRLGRPCRFHGSALRQPLNPLVLKLLVCRGGIGA